MTADEENVSVLVCIRPLNAMEIEACGRVVAHKTPGEPQLSLGEKKQFTYDSVYPTDCSQSAIFDGDIQQMLDG